MPRDPHRVLQVLLHHPAVRALVRTAADLGVEAHLVGGALRDRLLGLPSRDLDAAVSERGEDVARRLADDLGARLVVLGGRDFGAYRLVSENGAGSWVVDLWDREGGTLAADLARRDFTVNSMALTLPGGELVDPHGGLAELRGRLLRATGPSAFSGDPLRVLRLPRLLVQLPGFSSDPVTLALAQEAASRIAAVASERVRDELSLLFSQPDAHRGLAVLGTLDLYPGLWLGHPGEAAGDTGTIGPACGQMARLGPLALRLRELAGGDLPFPVRHRLARLALTFANLPRDAAVGTAAPGEAGIGEALALFGEAGYLTKRDTGDIARLVPWDRLPEDALDRRRFLHRLGALWTTAVCHAGARSGASADGGSWEEDAAALLRLYRREGEAIVSPPRLLDGREIGKILGVPPGPEIGRALRRLEWAQVEGRVRTREEALRLVEHLARAGPGLPR